MKKGISIILSTALLSGAITPFTAAGALAENAEHLFENYAQESIYDKAVAYLDVMQLLPDAEETANITKGQAVNCIIKSIGLEELAMQYPDGYTYDEKMAAVAHDVGILAGTTPQEWALDSEITLEQCAKMLVVALGYGSVITDKNAYPEQYVAQATKLKIFRHGVSGQGGVVTVRDFILMLYETMQCEIVEISSLSGNNLTYDLSKGYLLEDYYLDCKSWVKSEGVVQADYYSSTIGNETCDYSQILIDEEYYTCESEVCRNMTGLSVDFVYTDPDKAEELQLHLK